MILGIDTSCYTTSLALIAANGEITADRRKTLLVKTGEKGLRQSVAVFQHLENLPGLFQTADPGLKLTAVIAATVPRPVAGSYLPVFRVGAAFGEAIAKAVGVPFLKTSHQEGHLRAGLIGETEREAPFLAWHISGGTTELLLVTPVPTGYEIEKIGGTSDLQAGQFVDRVGVALGAPFPAGPSLERMALSSESTATLPVVKRGLTVSFSGPESAAQRLKENGVPGGEIARQVFNCIGQGLLEVSLEAARRAGITRILLVGGVASNQIIRDLLISAGIREKISFRFARKELSSDNAVGIGLIGFDRLRVGCGNE